MAVHGRGCRANHPAVSVAAADLLLYLLGSTAVPELLPALGIQIAHRPLFLAAVAGHYIAIGIDEKGIEAHGARQKPFSAVDIIDQAVVKIGPKPLFGMIGAKQCVD